MADRRRWPKHVVKRGQIWENITNNGAIVRHVKSVSSCGVVSYTCNGCFRQCLLKTFVRWARAASLEFSPPREGKQEVGNG